MSGLLTISATEAKNSFGKCIEHAHREPVCVQRTGRNSVVIIDYAEYERLMSMEDAYWAMRASMGETSGFIGSDAAMQIALTE